MIYYCYKYIKVSELMSPLAKEIIDRLNREDDELILSEVLDFYEYVKQKKQRELQKKWSKIKEDDPTQDEIKIYENYKNEKEEMVSLENVVRFMSFYEASKGNLKSRN